MRLVNKVALITGASQGIGESIAECFVREGARVILTDITDELGQTVATRLGPSAVYQHLDVSNEDSWKQICAWVVQVYGGLDILVNNAGIMGLDVNHELQDPEYATLESWRRVHAVNLDGVFLGCKHAIALMKQKGGSIINLSSRSGIVGVPRAAAYASSKAAIRNHSKSVALYCCEEGYAIRCNTLCPAAILTPIWDPLFGDIAHRDAAIAAVNKTIPMQKMGSPIDVAYAAVYLASDESKYLTGSEITIDGGILAGTASSPKPFKHAT